MKNINQWKPTKFILENNIPKAHAKNIFPGSFIIVSILAKVYYSAISKHANGRLLDLGCGNVPLYTYYKDYVDEIICIDWQNSFHKNKFIDFEADLNKSFPAGIGKFNTIISTDVLEHIEKPDIFFSQISKHLLQRGTLILSTPFLYWLHEVPYDYHRFTQYKLEAFCKENGLEIVELKPYGGKFEVLADLTTKIFSDHKILVKVINKFFSFLLSLNRFSNRDSSLFPLGYLLIAKKL